MIPHSPKNVTWKESREEINRSRNKRTTKRELLVKETMNHQCFDCWPNPHSSSALHYRKLCSRSFLYSHVHKASFWNAFQICLCFCRHFHGRPCLSECPILVVVVFLQFSLCSRIRVHHVEKSTWHVQHACSVQFEMELWLGYSRPNLQLQS